MTRRLLLWLSLTAFWPTSLAAADTQDYWVLVTAPAFRVALQPLYELRRAQGLRVDVVETTDVLSAAEIRAGRAEALQAHVNELCRDFPGDGTRHVLLVGAVMAEEGMRDPDRKVLPPLPGTFGRMKGEPSDNGYGLMGNGLRQMAAVGRFPVRTEEEARQLVAKTIAYETDRRPGPWRRHVTILAGAPLFNPTVDALVERVAMSRLSALDRSWSGRAIYHNPQSRFCVPDELLHDQALAYVQAGQAVTLFLGHSSPEGLYGGRVRFLNRDDWAGLVIRRGPGVFATFGCQGCQLRGPGGEGYGLAAVRNPHGPVAVLGSHGICFAAMVHLAADGFIDSIFAADPPERLGDCWLHLKAGLAWGKINPLTYRLLDAVDGDGRIPQSDQRLEHLEMFHLFGDPALKLPVLSQDVRCNWAGDPAPGGRLTVRCALPARLKGARVVVEVERPLDSEPVGLESLAPVPANRKVHAMQANLRMANHFVVSAAEARPQPDGRYLAEVPLPALLPWPRLTVRVYARTAEQDGLGLLTVPVRETRDAALR